MLVAMVQNTERSLDQPRDENREDSWREWWRGMIVERGDSEGGTPAK